MKPTQPTDLDFPPCRKASGAQQHLAATARLQACGGGLRDVGEVVDGLHRQRSEEHTSELQSLMRISYAVFCLKKTNTKPAHHNHNQHKQNTQHNNTHT